MKYDINHEFVSISSQSATHRIILIHGWGADADDLLSIGQQIVEISTVDFEVISLRAPTMHSNNIGRQWYRLFPPDWNQAENEVKELIVTLRKLDAFNIPLKKTILLGFSQGAAMAIDAGCQLDMGLIISCSGYPHPNWKPKKKCPPVLISHGLSDEVVPISASKNIYQKITSISNNFCFLNEFEGQHEIDPKFIKYVILKIKDLF